MGQFGIGQPVLRFEDPRLLRGEGRFLNDVNLPGQAHAVFVRSPHAHARIRSIDIDGRAGRAGRGRRLHRRRSRAATASAPRQMLARSDRDGSPMFAPQRPRAGRRPRALRRRPGGDGDRRDAGAGEDAAELVEVDYEPLPSVTVDRGHGRARRARGLGRVPRQHLATSSSAATRRRPRRRSRAAAPRRQAPLRDHPRACAVHGAARRARRLRPGRGSLHALCRRAVSRTACATCWPTTSSRCPRAQMRVIARRRRRRLRHQGLAVSRAPPVAVGGAQAAAGR